MVMKEKKNKIINIYMMSKREWIVTFTFVAILLFLMVRIFIPNKDYSFSVFKEYMPKQILNDEIVCQSISLPVGIYNVEVDYHTEDEGLCAINAYDSTVFYGGLKSNGTTLWGGNNRLTFTVWLYESTDELCLKVSGTPNTGLEINQVRICETNLFWTRLAVIICGIYFLYLVCEIYVRKNNEGMISRDTKVVILGMMIISIFCCNPYLLNEFLGGGDLGYHLERIEGVKDCLENGIWPVRLEPNFPFEYGYANGVFYSDLFLVIPALLRMAGFTVMGAYHIFASICLTSDVVVSWYVGKRIFKNTYLGLLFSAIYSLSIYHLFDEILRGGTGTLVATIFLPVLVLGYYELYTFDKEELKRSKVWLTIAVGYSGIICNHILTLELSAFWTIVVIISCIKKTFQKETLLTLVKAFATTVLLNLWFIIPFLDYYISENFVIKNVSARLIQPQGLSLSHYFRNVFDVTLDGGKSYFNQQGMETVAFVIFLGFIIAWVTGLLKKYATFSIVKMAKRTAVFFVIPVITALQYFPWNKIQNSSPLFEKIVSSIQYPWRFLLFANLFFAITVCALLWVMMQEKKTIAAIGIVFLSLFSVLSNGVLLLEKNVAGENTVRLYDKTQCVGYLSGCEYLIFGTNQNTLRYKEDLDISGEIDVINYEKGALCADFDVTNSDSEEGFVELPLLHYKGYRAKDADGNVLKCIKGTNNVVRVIVPANYSNTVNVKFVSPFYWRISEIISLLTLLYLFINYKKGRSNAKCL